MPGDDLSSIPGLEDKHRRALARRQVTDLRSLANADRQALFRAMASIRPRPSPEVISRWQDDARSKLGEVTIDPSDWHTAASFAVVFARRKVGGVWERRVEAERTEVEPERDAEVWPGWDCEPVCGWMVAQLGPDDRGGPGPAGPEPAGPESASGAGGAQARPAAEPGPAAPAAGRTQLHIDRAVIMDAARRADVVVAGALVGDPPRELVAPVRVALTVSGGSRGTEVQAVTRILRRDRPGWNPQDPVVVAASGQAQFDLSGVPAGQHELALVAWAPDGTAKPVSVRLPPVTISAAAG